MAPRDFWLFPKNKLTVKENRFDMIREIEAATKERLRALTKDDFQSCFRSWQDRWNKYVDSNGEYSDGGNKFLLARPQYFLFSPMMTEV
jgi:hypothetical protein